MAQHDPRIGLMLTGYHAVMASVPTELERGPHGPLTAEEIGETVALMDRLGADIAAEREQKPCATPRPGGDDLTREVHMGNDG